MTSDQSSDRRAPMACPLSSNRLTALNADVVAAQARIVAGINEAAAAALDAGEALLGAKSLVPDDDWSAWLEETGIPARTARMYMALQRGGYAPATVVHLGLNEAERLASTGL